MSEVIVNRHFLMHEGGTKFYEVIVLKNKITGKAVVTRRWGKSTALAGGGEIKIEPFADHHSADSSARSVLRAKEKGGYGQSSVIGGYGLHGMGMQVGLEGASVQMVESVMRVHFDKVTAKTLAEWLGFTGIEVDAFRPAAKQEFKPAPERGNEWGSW